MDHRERVVAALDHRETDRVAIDLGSTIVTTTTRVAYRNLLEHLGLPPDDEPYISHRQMDTVYPREDLLRRSDADSRAVHFKRPWAFETWELPGDRSVDEYDLIWQKTSFHYDVVERPFADLERPSDLDSVQWLDPYDPGRVQGVREEARRLYEETDYAIVADTMCPGPFEGACFMRGYEQFCMDLYWHRDMAHAILDKITQTDIQLWDLFLQEVEPYVQVVALQGDDLGTQNATWIAPEMFRKDVKPYLRELYDFIHGKTEAKVFGHSCGSVFDVIDCGVEALNPIQRSAAKMDIAEMKRQSGSELVFWGGSIDVQQVLRTATHDQVRREVDDTIETLGRGGVHVFCAGHSLQPDITPDRIETIYQAALAHGAVAA